MVNRATLGAVRVSIFRRDLLPPSSLQSKKMLGTILKKEGATFSEMLAVIFSLHGFVSHKNGILTQKSSQNWSH